MLTQDQIQGLKAPCLPEALSSDNSRGFELTRIKAAQAPAVIERLHEVFGPCGIGWRYTHSPFEELHTNNGRVEIAAEVTFQHRLPATNDCASCDQVEHRPAGISALAVPRRPHRRRQTVEAAWMDRGSCRRCGSPAAQREPSPPPGGAQVPSS